ncbi:CMP-N-acetylneuraminate-poly-alpha-2,8-sialyltransferase-like isoform X2 [Branchiostoma lanceolatum]|uniref:CMP-N-acetylneuraminate-poly-alpha-2, 8-sialyltransferase-like isoform X2 n=1 Tax=Branchiostoma lanceolatum TaxID=7740 RepID=UPI003455C7CE
MYNHDVRSNMAARKTCFRLMACGLLFTISMSILTGMKVRQPSYQVPVHRGLTTSTVSSIYGEWVMKHFNPDEDLTVVKSQVYPGQRILFEFGTEQYMTIDATLYRLIPEVSPLHGKHFRSCAVLGNSGILLGSRCGPQIDSADFVFRSNLPPIEGFEKDVGTKSNFTTMNPSVLPNDYDGYRGNNTVRMWFLKRLRLIGNQILHIPAFVSPPGTHDVRFTNKMIKEKKLPVKLTYAPNGTNEKMKAMWEDSEFMPSRPSTGSILFALAACMCDHIHLYGFYPFSEDEMGRMINYHYYGTIEDLPGKHNMTEEYRAYLALHQRKALVLHTEPCNHHKMERK